MRQFKKSILSFVLTFCLLISIPLASNLVSSEPLSIGIIEAQAASKVKLNKSKLVLIKGQTYTLKVSGTKKKVKWSTSKKSVATVDKKGKVTAKKKGTATISAKVGKKTYKCTVTVETPSISKTKANITIFASTILSVKGTKQKVTWKSSNTKIATVTSKGKVTAKKLGTATITATVGEKKKKYTCKVTVIDTKKGQEFTKLKKVIEQYGYFDKDGDLSLEEIYSDGNGNYNVVNVYILNNTLLFVLNSGYESGSYSYIHLKLDKYSNNASVYFEYYDSINQDGEPDDIATASLNSTKWNNHIVKFDIEQSTLDYDDYYLIDNLANACLRTLMYDSNELLKTYGFSLNRLGFDAFIQ